MKMIDEMSGLLKKMRAAQKAVEECDPHEGAPARLKCQNGHIVLQCDPKDAAQKLAELNDLHAEGRYGCASCNVMWDDEREDSEDDDFVYLDENSKFFWSPEYTKLKNEESAATKAYNEFCIENGESILDLLEAQGQPLYDPDPFYG